MKPMQMMFHNEKGLLMKIRGNTDIEKVSDEMRDILDNRAWERNPMSSVAFVRIIAHLVEIMHRSGYDPQTTSDFIMKGMMEAQKLAATKRY